MLQLLNNWRPALRPTLRVERNITEKKNSPQTERESEYSDPSDCCTDVKPGEGGQYSNTFGVTESPHSPLAPDLGRSFRCLAAMFLIPLKTQRGGTIIPDAETV